MGNFTSEIKKDLIAVFPEEACCGRAALRALLLTGGQVFSDRIEFYTENEGVAEYFVRLLEAFYSARPEVEGAFYDRRRARSKLTLSYRGSCLKELLSLLESAPPKRKCCALAYARAAFLGSGSCTLPRDEAKTGYHLEFVFPTRKEAEGFERTLLKLDVLSRVTNRGQTSIVYIKSGEGISDFLSIIGAENALKKFEKVMTVRTVKNRQNRISNCYAGNADKSAQASVQQILYLEKLKTRREYSELNAQLKEAAEARIQNPSLTLQELADELKLTKSCLNHRLRKLHKIYLDTEEKHD